MVQNVAGYLDRNRRRRGGVYVVVIAVTLIVSTIGFSAIMVSRLALDMSLEDINSREARCLAAAAAEYAQSFINNDPNWRNVFQNGVEYPNPPNTFGNGTYTWKFVDEDGDLADNDADSARLQGIGRVGTTVQVREVALMAAGPGLSCLEVAAHAAANMTFASGTNVTGTGTISANNLMIASGTPNLTLPMEAVNGFSGTFGPGSTTSGITPRQMPDPTNVFDYYLANGTVIDVSDLPMWGGEPTIQLQLLSAANNPYGTGQTNPEGIYIIDMKGGLLWVQKTRIVGTLVVLNPSRVEVYTDVNWEPAVANYPAMLVDGPLVFQIEADTTFNENSLNLNPPGTPYEGVEDNDQDDSYPSLVKGIVYGTGNVNIVWGQTAVNGVVIAGNTINVNADLELIYNSLYLTNPPPGFAGGPEMEISSGSWRRAASP